MMDFALARRNMVESQIRPNDVTDHRLIQAFLETPREPFVPPAMRELAYIDEDIPLTDPEVGNARRWLMEPMPFARLVALAEIRPSDLVLDIGCGTGYSAAILARLAESVVGIESDPALAEAADARLIEMGIGNAAIITGALSEGYPSQGPYDVIVLEGAVGEVPDGVLAQLRDGGRLVAPVTAGPVGKATLFCSSGGEISSRVAFDINVHPLPGFERKAEFVF